MLLDQVAFQHQRFHLRIGQNVFKPGDVAHHLQDFRRLAAAALEILPHPVFEADGLADVDDLVAGVMHQVNAGGGGEFFQLFFYIKSHSRFLPYCFDPALLPK